jgi:hypothetical protein
MSAGNKTVRQSITLPADLAAQIRTLSKTRSLSFNRMLADLIEKGIEVEQGKHRQDFFELANRFRSPTDSDEAKRLGDKLGRTVFGN